MEYYINDKKVTWEEFIKFFNNIQPEDKGKVIIKTE